MKRVFIGYVMIFSLLLAVCGCSDDVIHQQEPDLEFPNEPGETYNEPEKIQKPDIDQEKTGNNDPNFQDDPELNESDLTEVEPPEFLNFGLFSKKEIHFNFSTAVNSVFCSFTPSQEIDFIQDGKTVKVYLKENLELQTEFLIELNVKDDWENSLSVEVPLTVNDWIPKIEINELYTEYQGSPLRVEFIEFKVKSAGDLDGLQLYIMWDAKNPFVYNFPPVDIKLGEYVTLHLRTPDNTCVNELGENLNESGGIDSCPTARDLWIHGITAKYLHRTDIVYLQDSSGNVLDAVILNETPGEKWSSSRQHFAEIMEDLYYRGAWKSTSGQLPGPFDAVDTSSITATKTVSRYEEKENTHTANDWFVTNTNGKTPGQPNR
jgi:hypothetical protein